MVRAPRLERDDSVRCPLGARRTGGAVAGAFLGDKATAAIFPGNRFSHAAGQAAPTGKAERVEGGYRISGRYSFGSGTARAQWIVGGYVLHEHGKPVIGPHGLPVMLIGLAPRETVRFLGNWDVLTSDSAGPQARPPVSGGA